MKSYKKMIQGLKMGGKAQSERRLNRETVAVSKKFIVIKRNVEKYHIYHRQGDIDAWGVNTGENAGGIDLFYQHKEFYADSYDIELMSSEKVDEMWERWSYPNYFRDLLE